MHFTVRWLADQIPHRIPPCPPIVDLHPSETPEGWFWRLPSGSGNTLTEDDPLALHEGQYLIPEDPVDLSFKRLLRIWLDAELRLLPNSFDPEQVNLVIADLLDRLGRRT
jgi:hypothetical protein